MKSSALSFRLLPAVAGLSAFWFALSWMVWLGAGRLSAAETNAPPTTGPSFQDFKLIYERNIFDPNRRARSNRRPEDETRPPRIESFALVGTLLYADGAYAFFDGNEPKYRTVLKPADSIAGYKLLEIAPNEVKLSANTNTIELPIGMQMKKQEAGEWQLSDGTAYYNVPTSSSVSTNEKTTEESSSSEGGVSDVLKRLMQKREQELNK